MTTYPFTISNPEVWLKNQTLFDLCQGVAEPELEGTILTGQKVWENSGTNGEDWTSPDDLEVTLINGVNIALQNNILANLTPPNPIAPTSITVGLVLDTRSGNAESHIFGKTGSLVIGHGADDALDLTIGSTLYEATDGVADIGSFDQTHAVIVRVTEDAGGCLVEAWVDGTKVIDTVAAETTLPTGTGTWFTNDGNTDHRIMEIFLYESALTDDEVDWWFGHWAWESWFGVRDDEFSTRLPGGHPYATSGPLAVSLEDAPGFLRVWGGTGTEALIKLRREVSPGTYGAWSESGWSWSEEPSDILKNITLSVDGSPVRIKRLLKLSTSAGYGNEAILDPHVSDDDFGTDGNWLEFSVELESPVPMGATVLWSVAEEIFTEGDDGNGVFTDQYANEQVSLYVNDFNDRVQDYCKVTFASKVDGTLPTLPDIEAGLGSPDQTYSDGGTITYTDINGSANLLLVMDITLSAGATGIVMEVGDQTNGGIFVYCDGTHMIFVAGSSATRTVFNLDLPGQASPLFSEGVSSTVAFHINGDQVDFYWEGTLVDTYSAVSPAAWVNLASDGRFGSPNGDYLYSDVIDPLEVTSGIVRSELRVYSNPTLSIALGSKDWFNPPFGVNPRSVWYGQSWESTYEAYRYRKSEIADLKNPGSVNYCASLELATTLHMDTSEFGFNLPAMHTCTMLKAGETWVTGTDTEYSSLGELLLTTGFGIGNGSSIGVVGTGRAVLDASAVGLSSINVTSNNAIEEGAFEVVGKGDEDDDAIFNGTPQDNATILNAYYGGMKVTNTGTSGISIVQMDEALSSDIGNQGNWYFGKMLFEDISLVNSRGSCFSTAGPSEVGALQFIELDVSFWGCRYDLGSFGNQQAHGMYDKGWVPQVHMRGGWFPAGPGGTLKLDVMRDSVYENFVSWQQKGLVGLHNNGTNDGTLWAATTDRTIRAGRHASRVCVQDFVGSELDDFIGRAVSHVHSEARRFLAMSLIDQAGFFFAYNGTSFQPAEYGGDSWFTSYLFGTILSVNANKVQLPESDDRSQERTYGNHNCGFFAVGMLVHTDTDDVFRVDGIEDFAASQTAGRCTDFLLTSCHFDGVILEYDDSVVDVATDWGSVLVDCQQGTVTFASDPRGTDPLLTYFQGLGYADYDAVDTAIKNAWNGIDWNDLPAGLLPAEIQRGVAALLRPTGLDASNYGGVMPFYYIPQATVYSPVGSGDNADEVSITYDVPVQAMFGTVHLRRTGSNESLASMEIWDATFSNGNKTVEFTGLNDGIEGQVWLDVPDGALVARQSKIALPAIDNYSFTLTSGPSGHGRGRGIANASQLNLSRVQRIIVDRLNEVEEVDDVIS